jgi:hypothetical protein
MSTFCHGVASAQALDKSSEIVDIKGLDITSLPKTGIVNYEHKSDIPGQICGKILTAKKIFSKDDCENEHEEYFWKKCKVPFVYITAELLDDYCQSGKDAAGILRYDHDKKDQNKHAILGFSVEGSEIPNSRGSNSMVVARGIARKVTLTSSPCNQLCIAELLVTAPDSQIKDDFESIFKSTEEAITLFKSGEGEKIYEDYLAKKEADAPYQKGTPPKNPKHEYENVGTRAGTNKSGKHVYSHGHIGSYGYNPAEHKESSEHHVNADVTATNPKLADDRVQRMAANKIAATSSARQQNRAALSLNDKAKIAEQQGKQVMAKTEKPLKKDGPPPTPAPDSPPEPNQANAAAMQAGAMSGGPSLGQAISNIKSGLGFGKKEKTCKHSSPINKSEPKGWSKGKVDKEKATVHWNHPEHKAVSIQKQPSGEFHVKHHGALAGVGGVKGSFSTAKEAGNHARKYMEGISNGTVLPNKPHNNPSPSMVGKSLNKAITAGSMNAAPSTLVNGSAYQSENLQKPIKKDWNKRANQDYDKWPDKDKFEKFMKARLPHLAAGEIRAIGKLVSLKKSIEFEKALGNLISLEKAEDGQTFGPATRFRLAKYF